MKKQILIYGALTFAILLSCVPAKKYDELKDNYADLEEENNALKEENTDCDDAKESLTEAKNNIEAEKKDLQSQYDDLERQKKSLEQKYDNLKESYDALEENSSATQKENSKRNRELLAEIDEKQDKLDTEKKQLEKLQSDLEDRGKRIDELEDIIASKENQMKKLKDNISTALTDFEGKGLEVYQKNGKVYVSMENKLLFKTASWDVNVKGQEAIQELSKVLADNPDIQVLIEGHTDDVPYQGSGQLKDNWDLSTKRATAVVHILMKNSDIDPKNLTAAGRSEFAPVADNTTNDGKAKNRRIEVVLTPELDKLNDLLGTDEE